MYILTFWVKKIFPWKFNLEYGGTFTKLFMHVSSQNMFPTTRNLQICVQLFTVLAIVVEID
jgi:lauroyl/myristoyl acyltransferase